MYLDTRADDIAWEDGGGRRGREEEEEEGEGGKKATTTTHAIASNPQARQLMNKQTR